MPQREDPGGTVGPADRQVLVPAWAVIQAIRYGLPRLTYAHGDAIRLILEHAQVLVDAGWADTLRRDLDSYRQEGDQTDLALHALDEATVPLRTGPRPHTQRP